MHPSSCHKCFSAPPLVYCPSSLSLAGVAHVKSRSGTSGIVALKREAAEKGSRWDGVKRRSAGEENINGQAETDMNEGEGSLERKGEKSRKRRVEREKMRSQQVRFACPMDRQPRVAILGGGMSGLLCALTLEKRGIRSTVFDTGKHGLGGRMGTRHVISEKVGSLTFDHAAQYFTATDVEFQKLVQNWILSGKVREWHGVVGRLQKGGGFVELPHFAKYIASYGMRDLADHIISQSHLIDVKRPCWISKMEADDYKWNVTENGKPHGNFDVVIIAHNGKCANRLLGPSGVPLVAKQMKSLELSSIWALLAAFEEPLPLPNSCNGKLEAAFVDGVSSISWIANNSTKLSLTHDGGPHCWTFLSTAAYGKRNKVPQESIPAVRAERVKREILEGVETALGLPKGTLPIPFYTRVQLWGAALPINTPNVPCIFDPYGRVGICGDWLLGSSLQSAALSGMAMAHHIADYAERGETDPESFSMGLRKGFSEIIGHDIGQFPGVQQVNEKIGMEMQYTA